MVSLRMAEAKRIKRRASLRKRNVDSSKSTLRLRSDARPSSSGLRVVANAELLADDALQFAEFAFVETFRAPEDAAAVVEQDQRGIAADAEFGPHRAVVVHAAAEEKTVVYALALAEAGDLAHMVRRVAAFLGNADDFEAVVAIDVIQRVQVPDCFATWHAPGAPKIEKHQAAAAILAEFPSVTVEVVEREVFQVAAGKFADAPEAGTNESEGAWPSRGVGLLMLIDGLRVPTWVSPFATFSG